jgi:xylulokinase
MESTGSATNISISTGSLPGKLAEGLLYSCHAVSGQFLVEQGIGSTGMALRWFRDSFNPPEETKVFGEDPYSYIDRQAGKTPPGSNGLIFLPFMMGAQATRWNPMARGVIFGLTLGHGYGEVARSILEGIAYEIKAAVELLQREGMSPKRILALGGSARSNLWNQIKADVTARKYTRPEVGGASYGAMLLAQEDVGPPGGGGTPNSEKVYTPDPANVEIYRAGFSLYEQLYRACVTVFNEAEATGEGGPTEDRTSR